jgi:hypothetical protein
MRNEVKQRAKEQANKGQALSGAGAVDPIVPTTYCTSTGAAQALTLADGRTWGQRKRIVHVVDGGSVRLTAGAALHLRQATIPLADVRDWIELEWLPTGTNGAGQWELVGWYGTGVTFT